MRCGSEGGCIGHASLYSPTAASQLCVPPAAQDGGDPFNYQDQNLGWIFQRVAAGANHTAAIVQVGAAFGEHAGAAGLKEAGRLPAP